MKDKMAIRPPDSPERERWRAGFAKGERRGRRADDRGGKTQSDKTVMGDVGNFVNLLDPSTICWSYGAGSEGNGGIL